MTVMLALLVYLLIFFCGMFFGIWDTKKQYRIPRGYTCDDGKWTTFEELEELTAQVGDADGYDCA